MSLTTKSHDCWQHYNISSLSGGWGALKRLFTTATSLAGQNAAAILHGASKVIKLWNLGCWLVVNHVIILPTATRWKSEAGHTSLRHKHAGDEATFGENVSSPTRCCSVSCIPWNDSWGHWYRLLECGTANHSAPSSPHGDVWLLCARACQLVSASLLTSSQECEDGGWPRPAGRAFFTHRGE